MLTLPLSSHTNLVVVIIFLTTTATSTVVRERSSGGPVVTTLQGKIRGLFSQGASVFYGVRYAAPPARWTDPQEPASWGNDVYDASVVRPACPQNCTEPVPVLCPTQTSEDCLFLNIFAPSESPPREGWPVMVYIHGGAFKMMYSTSPLFDGSYVASTRKIVVVTFNYRLGALGFLVHGSSVDDTSGNYGIKDQQRALEWIHNNIHSFGGDPSKVTLNGQSAGAEAVLLHMTLPSSDHLFHRGIATSGPYSIDYRHPESALQLTEVFAEALSCTPGDLQCLRSKAIDEIILAESVSGETAPAENIQQQNQPWAPYVDGVFIEDQTLTLIKRGQMQRKPLLVGADSEDGVFYTYFVVKGELNILMFSGLIMKTLPGHLSDLTTMYPPDSLSDTRQALSEMITDWSFYCPSQQVARILANQGRRNVWHFMWDRALSFPGWGNFTVCNHRVCHGAEIVYFFHTPEKNDFHFTEEEEQVSKELIDSWTDFAKHGDPNHSGQLEVDWPPFTEVNNWPLYAYRSPHCTVEHDYHRERCQFWESVYHETHAD